MLNSAVVSLVNKYNLYTREPFVIFRTAFVLAISVVYGSVRKNFYLNKAIFLKDFIITFRKFNFLKLK